MAASGPKTIRCVLKYVLAHLRPRIIINVLALKQFLSPSVSVIRIASVRPPGFCIQNYLYIIILNGNLTKFKEESWSLSTFVSPAHKSDHLAKSARLTEKIGYLLVI